MWFVDCSYKCELCEKGFTQAGNLMQHISDVHKGKKKSVNTAVKCLAACTAYSDTFRTIVYTLQGSFISVDDMKVYLKVGKDLE